MEKSNKIGKFEGMKPRDGEMLAEYLQEIKQNNIPEYYVPYGVQYVDSLKVNYYVENKVNYLTVEYEVPGTSKEEEPKKVKLILAKHENTISNPEETETTLRMFFANSKKYATQEALNPIAYIAKLEKMGWEFTSEGIQLMQTSKQDGEQDIKRTQFTEAEIEELNSSGEIEENKKRHIDKREHELIEGIKQYIVKSYNELPNNLSEEIDTYKEKVERYNDNKKSGKESRTDLLEAMFRELKPIKEGTKIIPLMQRSFTQNIEAYLDIIPPVYRDKNIHNIYRDYMVTREIAIKEKAANGKVLPKDSLAEDRLEKIVTMMDAKIEKNKEVKVEEVKKQLETKSRTSAETSGMEIA